MALARCRRPFCGARLRKLGAPLGSCRMSRVLRRVIRRLQWT